MAVAVDRHPRRRPLRRGHLLARGAPLWRRPGAEGAVDAGAGIAAGESRPGDLDARIDCQIGTWLSMGPLSSGVPMGASHGIGYVLGAEFGVPHGYTSCVMLPSVMRWNKAVNAERQALVAVAMGHPGEDAGDVLDDFIRGLGMPRSLQRGQGRPGTFRPYRASSDGDTLGATQPAQDRGTGAGARNSGDGRVGRSKPRCIPAST